MRWAMTLVFGVVSDLGWALTGWCFWGWFAVPLGLPPLSYPACIGLRLLQVLVFQDLTSWLSFVRSRDLEDSDAALSEVTRHAIHRLLLLPVTLAYGFVWSLILGALR